MAVGRPGRPLKVPAVIHWASLALLRAVSARPASRAATEAVLRRTYARAREGGLTSFPVPLWYRWLRTYYFAALRGRLANSEFQRKYWEVGSLVEYRKYLNEADDERIRGFLEIVVARAREEQLLSSKPVRILEVGCGDGLPLKVLSGAFDGVASLALFGIDTSMQGLRIARDATDCASLIQASVTDLPFRRRFHLCFCRGVLMFIEPSEVKRAFIEMARVCRTLVLTEPALLHSGDRVDLRHLEQSIQREDIDQTNWVHPYRRLASESGGVIVAEEYLSGNCVMTIRWDSVHDRQP
jgi:SAM-dependent methyltransferase